MKAENNLTNTAGLPVIDEDELEREFKRLLGHATRWCIKCGLTPDTDAHEILNEAIADLFETPANCDQIAYLMMRIRQLACNRIGKITRQSDLRKNNLKPADDVSNALVQQTDNCENNVIISDLSEQCYETLWSIVDEKEDENVGLLLEAYKDGHEKRSDILTETGLTRAEYEAAKKRLKTMLRNLPQELRNCSKEAIGGTA